jgi:hypothetical protein
MFDWLFLLSDVPALYMVIMGGITVYQLHIKLAINNFISSTTTKGTNDVCTDD